METVKESVTDAVDTVTKGEPDERDPVRYYDGIITAYEREFKKWETRADKVVKRYRDEQRAKQDNDHTKFNILWSNVQTLVPAVYSRLPQPDVSRRHRDQDPVGRVASLILERALEYEVGNYPDYKQTGKQCVQDRFLPGRATAWARYEPHFRAAQLPTDGLQVTEDVDEPQEELDYECAPVDYVAWKDFGHNVARTWEEVFVVWRIVYMFEEGVEERFGEKIAKSLPYDASPQDTKRELTQSEVKRQAKIYEIWDKQKKKVFWICRGPKKINPLDERDDPLGLQDFFPCPRPLYATMTNDSLIPVPDFAQYQDQARELDTIADRIDGLVHMLQVKGVYDASTPELARLFTEGVNGTLIPVKNFMAFAEKKGLQGSMDLVDLKPIYEAIKVCFEAAREIINFIYQITGISDIVRGQTEAGETLGAQQLKVNFVGLRLGDMKRDVARYATDLLQLKAQIICQHFSPQTIMEMAAVEQMPEADLQYVYQMGPGPMVPGPPDPMTGQPTPIPGPPQPVMGPDGKPLPGPALALLIGEKRMADPESDSPNPMRAFRIEVNADSLVQIDEQMERESAKEFIGGMSGFIEMAVQTPPPMLPMVMEMIKWSSRKYKIGKSFEGVLDQVLNQMMQAASQPPPPDPAVEMEKAKAQAAQQKAQLDVQVAQQKADIDVKKMQMEQQNDIQQMQIDGAAQVMDMQNQRQQHAMKTQQMAAQHAMKMREAKMPRKPS